MEETRVCPRCGKKYKGYPALSRRDNETPICPNCGVEEALEDWFNEISEKGGDRNGTDNVRVCR